MSKKRIQRPVSSSSSSSEEETSRRQSQSRKNTKSSNTQHAISITGDDYGKFATDAVFWILTQEKKRVPFKKGDLMKAINLTGKPADVQKLVIEDVVRKLNIVYGIEMTESKEQKGVYYLVNKMKESLNDQENNHMTRSTKENAQNGLLVSVLGLVFMSNGVVKEDVLFKFLRQLGVHNDNHSNRGIRSSLGSTSSNCDDIRDAFGANARDLVFTHWGQKQHYLEITKIDSADPDQVFHEFRWGPRAHLVVDKRTLLQIISQMFECQPEAFKEQLDQILEEEEGKETN